LVSLRPKPAVFTLKKDAQREALLSFSLGYARHPRPFVALSEDLQLKGLLDSSVIRAFPLFWAAEKVGFSKANLRQFACKKAQFGSTVPFFIREEDIFEAKLLNFSPQTKLILPHYCRRINL
jgi:hypothetical protein